MILRFLRVDLVTSLAGSGLGLWFVLGALDGARGPGASFAGCLIGLVVAAVVGPFLFDREAGERGFAPARRAAQRSALLAASAALICGLAALLRDGPLGAALVCGLFCGWFAFSLAALADLAGGDLWRPAFALLGLALLATLFYWDDAFLLRADDRKASAALAFALNPAAAVSVTLDFDWIHAKALYTNNQTAESMVNVPRSGIGRYALLLAAVTVPCVGLGGWRRR